MFVSFLNKQYSTSFVCICKRINKALGEFYKTRNLTTAPTYNRVTYKVTVNINDTASIMRYEKLSKSYFTITKTLMYSCPEYDWTYDSGGFCDTRGRQYSHLFINKT